MVQAAIRIDGVTGSNPPNGTALVVGAVVAVTNVNNGGEITYLWEFADRPEGSAAAFAAPALQTTAFTPDVEGTYLIRLSVNKTLASERIDTQIAAISQVKTFQRIPAAGEMLQAHTTRGWAEAVNRLLQLLDTTRADPGVLVGTAVGNIARGTVCRVRYTDTILAGLPGEAVVASFDPVIATDAVGILEPLFITEEAVDGNTTVGNGLLGRWRRSGVFGPLVGAPVVGDKILLSDAGQPALVTGTIYRKLGTAIGLDGANYYFMFDGAGAEAGNATAPYLIDGAFTGLANARNIQSLPNVLEFTASADQTIARFNKRNVADTSHLMEWIDEAAVVQIAIDTDFNVLLGAGAAGIFKSGGALQIGTVDANVLEFATQAVVAWQVTAGGDIEAVGADRIIDFLDAPTTSKMAARKSYVDAQVPIMYFGNTAADVAEHALDPGFGARVAPTTAVTHPHLRAPRAGTISNLYVRVETQPTVAGHSYTVYVNGGASAVTVSTGFGGGAEDLADTTHSVAVVLGDQIRVIGKPLGAVGVAAIDVTASFRFDGA